MKKQRPHKGSKAAKRARKARASANSAVLVRAPTPALSPIENNPPDKWAWHTEAGKRGPGWRAKGPPPRRQPSQRSAAAKPANAKARGGSKLAPALAALLNQPTAPPQQPLKAARWMRTALASRWREDRIAAAVLLVPTLLVASVLMLSPRQRAPLDQSPLVAVWRGAPPTAPVVAETAPIVGRYAQPFARPAERTMSLVPTARHDLDAVAPTLANDATWAVAMAGPPFVRPPEAVTTSVPLAAHDLPAVVAALARDMEANRAKAATPPEPRDSTQLSALPDVSVPIERHDVAVCRPGPNWHARLVASRTEPVSEILSDPTKFGFALSEAAKAQVADLVIYNAKYMTISYPGGDVPELFGVCTDVIIRAYRTLGIDLQELVHLSRPRGSDASIDHRRTELLRQFFATHGEQLATSPFIEDYLPGDIVTYYRPQNKSSQSHIAVVTDVFALSGRPMIAHNRGWGVQLEDALFVDQMTGHYRYRGPQPADALVASRKATTAQAASAKPVRTIGTQSAIGQDALQPTAPRKGLGRQTAAKPASKVQLASAKGVLPSGAQRMGLGMGPHSAEAQAQCADPAATEKGNRVCVNP